MKYILSLGSLFFSRVPQDSGQNDGGENDKPVDTLYIGDEDIKMAVRNLKAELHQARLDTSVVISSNDGIEETIEAKQAEPSVYKGDDGLLESL